MDQVQRVVDAARRRAAALASGNADELRALLHPAFVWTSHIGETFDRERYVDANTAGGLRWRRQSFEELAVEVVGEVAVLTCVVSDEVEAEQGIELFRMPMTQTWILIDDRWLCLAGHAGPLLIG